MRLVTATFGRRNTPTVVCQRGQLQNEKKSVVTLVGSRAERTVPYGYLESGAPGILQ